MDNDNDNDFEEQEYGIDDGFNSDDDIENIYEEPEEKDIKKDATKQDDDEAGDGEEEDDDDEQENLDKEYLDKEYKTKYDFITKYEYCRLIEALCKIICVKTFNVHPDIPKDLYKIEDIATYWLLNENIPFPIDLVRKLNGRKSEIINVRKLKIINR